MKKLLSVIISGIALVAPSHSHAAIKYDITDLGIISGYASSQAAAINNQGQVIGRSYNTISTPGNITTKGHAFLYSGGVMQDLGTLGGEESSAFAINNSGVIVGTADIADGTSAAFTYSAGVMTKLLSDSEASTADGINDNGQIVGQKNGQGILVANGSVLKAFGSFGGGDSGARGINANGVIVGAAHNSSNQSRAFIYTGAPANSFGDYPVTDLTASVQSPAGWILTSATAINSAGQIVGYGTKDGNFHAYLYKNGIVTDLNPATGPSGFDGATAINANGVVVGETYTSSGNPHAFVYTGGVMYDLNNLIPTASGWTLTIANGINDSGQIVGQGINSDGKAHAYLLIPNGSVDPTPTPAIPPAPTAKLTGKKKVTVETATYPVKGTADGVVTKVTFRVGSKGAFKKAKLAKKTWSFTAKVKPGKNKISVIIEGPGGKAKPIIITVTRED